MAEAAVKQESTNLIDRSNVLSSRKRHYESIFILSPALDEKRVEEIVEKAVSQITSAQGEMLRRDDWGKLRMAYEIEKHQQGRYFYFRYISQTSAVAALERVLKLDADVLRYQTVKLSEDLSQDEMADLIRRAPNEAPKAPNVFDEEEDYV